MSDVKPILGVPVERNGAANDDCFWSLAHIFQQGWPLICTEYMMTDTARNLMCQQLLDTPECTHLVMLDSDQLHPPDTIVKMKRDAELHPEMLVIGGLHYVRGVPYGPNAYKMDKEGYLFQDLDMPAGLVEVAALGTGSIMIHRSVLERIKPPWFAYTYPANLPPGRRPSEDTYFSKLCREAGIRLWCDTTITAPHLRKDYIDRSTMLHYLQQHPDLVTREEARGEE
jgi:hypothetical protein